MPITEPHTKGTQTTERATQLHAIADGQIAERRIAEFLETSDRMSGPHEPTQHGVRGMPRFLRAFGHGPADHAANGPAVGEQDEYTADNIDLDLLVEQRTLEQVLASLLKHQGHQVAALNAAVV